MIKKDEVVSILKFAEEQMLNKKGGSKRRRRSEWYNSRKEPEGIRLCCVVVKCVVCVRSDCTPES